MGRDLRVLLLPDPPATFGVQLRADPPQPGTEQQAEPAECGDHRQGEVARSDECVVRGEEAGDRARHQQRAHHDPDRRDRGGRGGLQDLRREAAAEPCQPVATGPVGPGPQHRGSGGGDHDRQHQGVTEPQPEGAEQPEDAGGDQGQGHGLLGGGGTRRSGRDPPDRCEHPQGPVEQQSHPAGEDQDREGDPDQDRIDAEFAGETTGDTGDDPVVAVPGEAQPTRPRRTGPGHRWRGRSGRSGLDRGRHGDDGGTPGRPRPPGRTPVSGRPLRVGSGCSPMVAAVAGDDDASSGRSSHAVDPQRRATSSRTVQPPILHPPIRKCA